MGTNKSRKYALMTDEERRRFTGQQQVAEPAALDFEEPRDMENQGHSQMDQQEEAEDSEHQDGMATQLDEAAHDDAVDEVDPPSGGGESEASSS